MLLYQVFIRLALEKGDPKDFAQTLRVSRLASAANGNLLTDASGPIIDREELTVEKVLGNVEAIRLFRGLGLEHCRAGMAGAARAAYL